jgi:hypothetical protein
VSRGDRVEVYVDTGGPEARRFVIEATANGRKVEVSPVIRGMIEVSVVGRTGKVIKTDRYLATRVVALIEDKNDEEEE